MPTKMETASNQVRSDKSPPPPDLDKVLNDEISRYKRLFSNGKSKNLTLIVLFLFLALAAWTSIYTIPSDSVAVVKRFGKYSREVPPSLHFRLPFGIEPKNFNSYGSRRGDHEVMVRGTFANNRLKNKLVDPSEGGITRIFDSKQSHNNSPISIFEASQFYQQNNTPLVIFAGKEYGTGSSRDWAAKGCQLLGVKAVIAESFERIHRSNLVGMGIMPLQLSPEMSVAKLNLGGDEKITVMFVDDSENNQLAPNQLLQLTISPSVDSIKSEQVTMPVTLNIINSLELNYFLAGGILPYVARQFL